MSRAVVIRGRSLTNLGSDVIYHDEVPGSVRTACKRWADSYYPAWTRGPVVMKEEYAMRLGRLCKDCRKARRREGRYD